jgi:type I restriction enzyme M protein
MKQQKAKTFFTQQSLNRAIINICDVLRRSNCAGAMQYIPELTWVLFLRILDEQEIIESEKSKEYKFSIEAPYRWQDWASPESAGKNTSLLTFINNDLFPYLKNLVNTPSATGRQKVISEIISNVEKTKIDTEYNLRDVLNRVHQISIKAIDSTHIFALSQVYEGLLLRMGQKSNDGGQFFTPREVIRAMVKVINPKSGESIYDPCCGTGGFIAQSHEHIRNSLKSDNVKSSFYGREKENLVYPLALANLVLHGVDEPHIWHGNTLTGQEMYGGLFQNVPEKFDVILTNPPFGGKESKTAQEQFTYPSSSTQLLFLQHVIDNLAINGRCGIVVDEGILFRTNDSAFAQTKRKLIETCNIWCIVSLPIGTFINAGASIKTDILFFTKGQPTERIWYYDLSGIKLSKKTPLVSAHFDEFFELLPSFALSERSWFVSREQIEKNNYDLKAVNPNLKIENDNRTLDELLELMQEKSKEIEQNIQILSSSSQKS